MQPDPTVHQPPPALRGARLLVQELSLLQQETLREYAAHVQLLVRLQSGLEDVEQWWATALNTVSWRPPDDHPAAEVLLREQHRRESNLRELRNCASHGNQILRKITAMDSAAAATVAADPKRDEMVARVFGDSTNDIAVLPHDLSRLNHFFRQKTQRLASNVLFPYLRSVVLALTKPFWEHKTSLHAAMDRGECADVDQLWLDLRLTFWQRWESYLADAKLELIVPSLGDPVDHDLHETLDNPIISHTQDVSRDQIGTLVLPGLRWPDENLLLAHAQVFVALDSAESFPAVLPPPSSAAFSLTPPLAASAPPEPLPTSVAPLANRGDREPDAALPSAWVDPIGAPPSDCGSLSSPLPPERSAHPADQSPDSRTVEGFPPVPPPGFVVSATPWQEPGPLSSFTFPDSHHASTVPDPAPDPSPEAEQPDGKPVARR